MIKRAVFFAGVGKFGTGKPHRVGRLLHYCIHQPFVPSLVVDVTSVWPAYREALAAYESQFLSSGGETGQASTALSDGRFLQVVEARSRHYGAMINAEHGEPYFSAAPLSIDSPAQLLPPGGATTSYSSIL